MIMPFVVLHVSGRGSASNVTALRGSSKLGEVELTLSHDTKSINISLSGPADVWFGIGFDATAMKDHPYAVIVDGEGAVTERKLADHAPGKGKEGVPALFATYFGRNFARKFNGFFGERKFQDERRKIDRL